MKKVLIAGILGIFAIGMVSCGGGHTCDAYRTSDYSKYKKDHNQKVQILEDLSKTTK